MVYDALRIMYFMMDKTESFLRHGEAALCE
jgi:hypothetical protein